MMMMMMDDISGQLGTGAKVSYGL